MLHPAGNLFQPPAGIRSRLKDLPGMRGPVGILMERAEAILPLALLRERATENTAEKWGREETSVTECRSFHADMIDETMQGYKENRNNISEKVNDIQ